MAMLNRLDSASERVKSQAGHRSFFQVLCSDVSSFYRISEVVQLDPRRDFSRHQLVEGAMTRQSAGGLATTEFVSDSTVDGRTTDTDVWHRVLGRLRQADELSSLVPSDERVECGGMAWSEIRQPQLDGLIRLVRVQLHMPLVRYLTTLSCGSSKSLSSLHCRIRFLDRCMDHSRLPVSHCGCERRIIILCDGIAWRLHSVQWDVNSCVTSAREPATDDRWLFV